MTLERRIVAAVVLVVLAACARDTEAPRAAPTDPAATGTTSAPDETGPPTACKVGHEQGGSQDAAMLLRAVRVAGQTGFDRITFEFIPRDDQEPKTPFWRVSPTRPPLLQDGSGEEMSVEGRAFLGITMWASGVDLSGDEVREVYTGPKRIDPGDTQNLQQLRHAGDFENVLTWYAGLRRASCFEVRELDSPVRIVVDIRHDGPAAPYPSLAPPPDVNAPSSPTT